MIHTQMTGIYFDFRCCPTHLIPQGLTIRDRVATRGGNVGFCQDRAAKGAEAPASSQVVDLLLGLIQ